MKLLIDMNLSPRWVEVLKAAGFDAAHWAEVGSPTATDPEIMAFAQAAQYTVLTHDLDFGAILAATGGRGPSVVQLRADDTSPDANASTVVQALEQCAAELRSGALLTVNPARSRLSLLPLRS